MKRIFQALRLQSNYLPYLTLIGIAILVYGNILFNDGVYWDGWLIYSYLKDGNWTDLLTTFQEAGLPILATLHWGMRIFPNLVFGYHLISFICVALTGILIYRVLTVAGLLTPGERFWVVAIALVYPAFQVRFEMIILPYPLGYCLFWTAALLALLSKKSLHPGVKVAFRIFSLILFLFSFTINSLLVYYAAFILLLLWVDQRTDHRNIFVHLAGFIPRTVDYLALPFIYWFGKEYLFPTTGLYKTYNQLDFSRITLFNGTKEFLRISVLDQINGAFNYLANHPILWVGFLILALPIPWLFYHSDQKPSTTWSTRKKSLLVFGMGLLILFAGIFPYVAVGKIPSAYGWNTRHTLLIDFPIALMLVSLVNFAFHTRDGRLASFGYAVLLTLFLAFSLSTMDTAISWQVRGIKDRAVMYVLANQPAVPTASVYWVDDQIPIPNTDDFYRFYEWSSMFKQIWGTEGRIGFDTHKYKENALVQNQKYFTSRYNLETFDPAGCQARLKIQREQAWPSDFYLVYHYQVLRIFKPAQLDPWLSALVKINIRSIQSPSAKHCLQTGALH